MGIQEYFNKYGDRFPLNERVQMSVFDIMWRFYMTPKEFGDLVGVSASTVRSWRDGKVKFINWNNFTKLWPIIHDTHMRFEQQGLYPG